MMKRRFRSLLPEAILLLVIFVAGRWRFVQLSVVRACAVDDDSYFFILIL